VARIIPSGRIYLRALIEGLKKLKHPQHKLVLNSEILTDIAWWQEVMPYLNGSRKISINRSEDTLVFDACCDGAGLAYGNDWLFVNWKVDFPEMAHLHINYKEAFCALIAARRWGHLWGNKCIHMFTDSMVAMGMIIKAKAADQSIVNALKELYVRSAIYDFNIKVTHIAGRDNILADCISRLSEHKMACMLMSFLPLFCNRCVQLNWQGLCNFMSFKAFLVLLLQGSPLTNGERLWTQILRLLGVLHTPSQQKRPIGLT
jgi:hypothetical protein